MATTKPVMLNCSTLAEANEYKAKLVKLGITAEETTGKIVTLTGENAAKYERYITKTGEFAKDASNAITQIATYDNAAECAKDARALIKAGVKINFKPGDITILIPKEEYANYMQAVKSGALAEAGAGEGLAEGLALGIARRAALPLAAAIGGYQTYQGIKHKDGHETAQAVGATVGGVSGGWAGAAGGAAIGTAICPGPGTVIGGIIGGLVVGAGGAYVGAKATDAVAGNAADNYLKGQHPSQLPIPQNVNSSARRP